MSKKKQSEDYSQKLEESFARWDYLYTNGGTDPFWPDGVNLNLVRNHIRYYKKKIEAAMTLMAYPAVFHRPTPAEVEPGYVVSKPPPRKNITETPMSLGTAQNDEPRQPLQSSATHPSSKAISKPARKPQQQIQLSLFA